MSNEEHYFENLLFAYANSDGHTYVNELIPNDSNLRYLTKEQVFAIQTCAVYIIDCCGWNPLVVKCFLDGDFKPSVKLSSPSKS